VQFDRSGFGKYIVSGPPDNYYQYVALRQPSLSNNDRVRVAALVRVNVESFVNDSLLVEGKSIRHGQNVTEIYSMSIAYTDLASSSEQLIGIIATAIGENLSEVEKALVEAIFSGNQAAIMESITEISPENAYMVPQGLPAPIQPGQTYSTETSFSYTGAEKKRFIPIKLVGQEFWGQETPPAWLEKIKGRTPEAPDELTQVHENLSEQKRALNYVSDVRQILQGGAQDNKEALLEAIDALPEGASAEDMEQAVRSISEREVAQVQEVWADLLMVLPPDVVETVVKRVGQDAESLEPITFADADMALARMYIVIQNNVLKLTTELERLKRGPDVLKEKPIWRTLEPQWMISWKRIQKNIPINTLEGAITEYPGDLSDPLTYEKSKDFFAFLLRPDPETGLPQQKGIGDVSNERSSAHWIAWWLENHGEVPPEEVFKGAPAEEPEVAL
jgi:hypothetical protein